MRFHIDFNPTPSEFKIDHSQTSFLIGSCFSENVGEKLRERKFKIISNPFGNLFNPFSIHKVLTALIKEEKADSKYFIQRDTVYYSYLQHSSINASTETELENKINSISQQSVTFLRACNYLFITFGTAFYYHHKALDLTVANCHKQVAGTFEKKWATIEEIAHDYEILIKVLTSLNPGIKIIFTVSPVKHLKDGVLENNLSKSTLILSVHQIVKQNSNCFYFPAYELVNDDLRDYRFYKEDLAHPNQQAIDYVWDKFSECYFSPKTKQLNEEINKLQLALNHRKMAKNEVKSHKLSEFIRKQKEEIKKLAPEIEF